MNESEGLIKPLSYLESLITTVHSQVPEANWSQLSPIFIERQLRADYPGKPIFLGCGLVYDALVGRVPRNSHWEKESQAWLANKVCAICGGKYRLVAHHIIPFHVDVALEMEPSNWWPLCEGRASCNCHISFGHVGNWSLINPKVKEMSLEYGLQFRQARG